MISKHAARQTDSQADKRTSKQTPDETTSLAEVTHISVLSWGRKVGGDNVTDYRIHRGTL